MFARRRFLSLLGGGAVFAAGGIWASTRDPAAARMPWVKAGNDRVDPRRFALSYAILAPNPHNRQPWIADMSVPGEVTLYCQSDRRLPATDPFDRQITIGLGAFLELFSMAAAEAGCRAQITLFPQGEPQPRLDMRPVAHIAVIADTDISRDPLFAYVPHRRTNREAFDLNRAVETSRLASIGKAARTSEVDFTNDQARVMTLRSNAWDAMFLEMSTPVPAKESVDLIRIGRAEIEANPDGISLSGPLLEGLSMIGLLNRADMLDRSSAAFQQQIPVLKLPFDSAMAFLWLSTTGNTRADQIRAGRDYIRLNLAAVREGLGMQPFSQALQEFPEMKPHYDIMRETLEIAPENTLQMLVRLGYGPAIKASPRWPYETRLRS